MEHQVGVRELKTKATQIIREVRERQAEYVITYQGRPVGVLRPWTGPTPPPRPRRRRVAREAVSPAWQLPVLTPDQEAELHTRAQEAILHFQAGLGPDAHPARDDEQFIDTISWGQWRTMSDSQRQALWDVLHAQAESELADTPEVEVQPNAVVST